MADLLRERDSAVDADALMRRRNSLRDDGTKALVHLLTGQKVQETAWWPEYVAHLKRRNAIVHKGLEIPASKLRPRSAFRTSCAVGC